MGTQGFDAAGRDEFLVCQQTCYLDRTDRVSEALGGEISACRQQPNVVHVGGVAKSATAVREPV